MDNFDCLLITPCSKTGYLTNPVDKQYILGRYPSAKEWLEKAKIGDVLETTNYIIVVHREHCIQ